MAIRPHSRGQGGLGAEQLRRRFSSAPAGASQGASAAELTRAAVLVPVVVRPDALSVLLTRRTEHLHHHPGQISFPGGREEADDLSPEMTALRETREEIGLGDQSIELLGRLPLYRTGTGFEVTPVVGLVHPPFALTLDSFEVAEAFEVPLDFVLDPANLKLHEREFEGRMRRFFAMPYGSYYIWGATAGMLVSLARFLDRG